MRLPSPDGKKLITINGFHVRLQMNGKRCWTPFGGMHDAELGWSPDSTRLFVTWSESGELGPWHTQIYALTNDGLREYKGITDAARADILLRERKARIPKWVTGTYRAMWQTLSYCEPDMIGSQWLNGSKEILVAARTGPDSGCKYMAEFVVYRLEAETGKLLQSYRLREAHQLFGDDDLPKIADDDEDDLGAADVLMRNNIKGLQ